jgi:hypothetical protein
MSKKLLLLILRIEVQRKNQICSSLINSCQVSCECLEILLRHRIRRRYLSAKTDKQDGLSGKDYKIDRLATVDPMQGVSRVNYPLEFLLQTL